jgi:hypothetical protein
VTDGDPKVEEFREHRVLFSDETKTTGSASCVDR